MRIDDKVVLITGASEGIGAACAHEFRGRGARLSLTARSEDKLHEVGGSGAVVTPGDLTNAETRKAAIANTIEAYGRIDVLINNAGVGLYQPAHRSSADTVRAIFDLNIFAALDMVQLAVPHMRQQGSGAIINIGSIAGKVTLPWLSIYSATKYCLGSLTEGLRMELKQYGIHCMIVCPGYVKTGFQKHALAGSPPGLVGRSQRWAITPEQCAHDIARGLERNARTVLTPRSGWALVAAQRIFPSLVEKQLEKLYRQQEPHL